MERAFAVGEERIAADADEQPTLPVAGPAAKDVPSCRATVLSWEGNTEGKAEVTKTWVLDTETKGTGANMVPLENRNTKPEQARGALYVPRKHAPRPAEPPAPRPARRFKVVDVVSRQVLAEGTDARATVDVLKSVRSIVDVQAYVWQPVHEKWRMLGLDELRLLWDHRGT